MIVTKEMLEEIRDLAGEKEDLEGLMRRHGMTPTTANITGMPRGTSTSDPTGTAGSAVADLKTKWDAKVAEIAERILVVEKELSVLDSVHRRIVRLYYFEGMSDRRIANRMRMHFDVIGRKRRESISILSGGDNK